MDRVTLSIEHQITRIRDRIRDIEWQIEQSDEINDEYLIERRRALDKLRHLQDDLFKHKMQNAGDEDET